MRHFVGYHGINHLLDMLFDRIQQRKEKTKQGKNSILSSFSHKITVTHFIYVQSLLLVKETVTCHAGSASRIHKK